MSIVYPKQHDSFLAVGLAPLLLRPGLSTSDDQRIGRPDDNFWCEASMIYDTRENWLQGEWSYLAQYHFNALVQRISNCSEIQSTSLRTCNKVLNFSIYGLPRFDEIH